MNPRFTDSAQALIDEGVEFSRRGQHLDALESYERALAVCRSIEGGDDESLAVLEAHAIGNKGAALAELGRHAEAMVCYDESLTIDMRLATRDVPERIRDRSVLAINRGISQMDVGRHKDALKTFHEALLTVERLVNEGHEEFVGDVALAHYNLGETLIRAGQFDEALLHHDKAIEVWRDLECECDVAYALSSEADSLMQFGQVVEEALAKADESIALFRILADAEPSPKATKDLATAVNLRGTILNSLGRLREAAACVQEAVAIREAGKAA